MTTTFITLTPLHRNLTPLPRTAICTRVTHHKIRAQQHQPTNSPLHLPTPTPHTPYKQHITETDALDTHFEQPPGGSPPSTNHNWSTSDDDNDLPSDLREALLYGSLTQSGISRYKNALKVPALAFLFSIPAFRTRALADPSFLFKLFVQILVGNGTALVSEIAVRGRDIVHELEYVASDLIVGTVVEAAFVWLLAPVLATPTKAGFWNFVERLPTNVFQPSGVNQFTVSTRIASFIFAGFQYAIIGFLAGIVGTGVTYGLIEARKKIDNTYQPERPLPKVLPNSLGWAAFMALSSNPRFQIVEGLELLVKKFNSPVVANGGIVALRLINNYWGGVQFVQFFRFLGLHATGDKEDEVA